MLQEKTYIAHVPSLRFLFQKLFDLNKTQFLTIFKIKTEFSAI